MEYLNGAFQRMNRMYHLIQKDAVEKSQEARSDADQKIQAAKLGGLSLTQRQHQHIHALLNEVMQSKQHAIEMLEFQRKERQRKYLIVAIIILIALLVWALID